MTYYYTSKIISDLNEIRNSLSTIVDKLNYILADDELLFDVRLILNELVINGCEHGNCFDASKQVSLKLKIDQGVITISVKDEGQGIDYRLCDYDKNSLRPDGRGLKIVQELSDQVIVQKNTITAVLNKEEKLLGV